MHIIHTPSAPQAIGPYVQAVRTGNLLFCSGQTPLNPETMRIEETGVAQQTRTTLKNLEAILHAAGLTLHNVLKPMST
jgi:2-iminobutanoate/2-iminopropanoate deaminase